MSASSSPFFNPSDVHQYQMEKITPQLRYAGGDVQTWRTQLQAKLKELVGEIPGERVPLRPRTLWKRQHPLGMIEKIVFTAEPFCDVPAYVCIPKNVCPPYQFVICLQGHTYGMHASIAVQADDEITPMLAEGDRDFAIGCMQHGLAALCIEQRSFGERREQKQAEVSKNGCHDAVMHALMLGRTLLGERVFDVDRGIDYLEARGDADMTRIGIMGISGGGTISIYAAALLPRIAFAVPSASFCTFRASIMSIYHCGDNYVPHLFKFAEMADVLGLFAPKPVIIVNGEEDTIFPIEGTQEAFASLKQIYAAWGAEDRCHLVIGSGGHRFYADQAWPILLSEINQH